MNHSFDMMVEMDYLGKDINSFPATGIVLARLELGNKHVCLETNGEKGDMYLELVEYLVDDSGGYVEQEFSEPIYEVPQTPEEVDAVFEGWSKKDIVPNTTNFTGGKEIYDEETKQYTYWLFNKGRAIKAVSPSFTDRKDFVKWMESRYE